MFGAVRHREDSCPVPLFPEPVLGVGSREDFLEEEASI